MKPAPLVFAILALTLNAAPRVDLLLPDHVRLLVRQRIDLVIEARELGEGARLQVMAGSEDITSKFRGPMRQEFDCNGTAGIVYRADLFEFTKPGPIRLRVELGGQSTERVIDVKPFVTPSVPRNYILFIGDAMGNSYRDAGRIVSRSVETKAGQPGLRQGFFDRLMEMDEMPVTGLVMTYGFASLVPDSAETASHWSTGSKPLTGMLSVLPDSTDCRWRQAKDTQALESVTDNPRIESFLEYLKRLQGYRTGNVSTAFLADATPAAQGAHVATRGATFEIVRQYLENPMLDGQPAFDVVLGGGKEDFDPDVRPDKRDLVSEFKTKGFQTVSTATELKQAKSPDRLLGLFRRANTVHVAPNGLTVTENGNMEPAYDKLGLKGRMNNRPGSEPLPDFSTWRDQPMLEEMAAKAIDILSGPDGRRPFAIQIEGALIDKQSHPNHAAGTIWDVIELDHAVGVARAWAKQHPERPTLILVTGDHDQTLSILGAADISDKDLTDRTPITVGGKTIFHDAAVNLRNELAPGALPGEVTTKVKRAGTPDYQDADGDGYPENREVNGKGRKRMVVGFRTGGHAGSSLPITAEGPGALLFTGYMDQTDIFFRSAQALTEDTTALDNALRLLGSRKSN